MTQAASIDGPRFVKIGSSAPKRNLSRVPPKAPFTLCHHPRQWYADHDAGRLLPYLTEITGQPGVNGAIDGDPQAGLHELAKQGFTALPVEVVSEMPGGYPGYLVAHPVQGGEYYSTPWVTPIAGASRVQRDPEGYRAFLCWLVDEGKVPPVEEYVVETRVSRLRRQHRDARRRAGTDPVEAERAARIEAEIGIWLAALEPAEQPDPTPSPASKPRRSRKTAAPE